MHTWILVHSGEKIDFGYPVRNRIARRVILLIGERETDSNGRLGAHAMKWPLCIRKRRAPCSPPRQLALSHLFQFTTSTHFFSALSAETCRAAVSQSRFRRNGFDLLRMQIARPDPHFPVFPLDNARAIADYSSKLSPISTSAPRALIGLACAPFRARLRQARKIGREKGALCVY